MGQRNSVNEMSKNEMSKNKPQQGEIPFKDDLRPLKDLKGCYLIADYQRGYRWTKQQVNELLNDIKDFSFATKNGEGESKDNGEDKGRYFLQTIVGAPINDQDAFKNTHGEKCDYEIIDGQQRLTTIDLIHQFFCAVLSLSEMSRKISFTLATQSRTKDNVITAYYIENAKQAIAEFFKNFDHEKLKTYYHHLCTHVYVLWYEPIADNAHERIAAFRRLNRGKIALTSAELCRALLLNPKYHRGNDDEQSEGDLRRALIGAKWDQMEVDLQEESFWGFLGQKESYETRIDFLLDFHFYNDMKIANDTAFHCLENKLENELENELEAKRASAEKTDDLTIAQKIFDAIYLDFQRLKSFYLDNDIYHWLGFLANIHSHNSAVIFALFHELKTKTKSQVKQSLKAKIINLWTVGDKNHRQERDLAELHFDKDKALIGHVLFFANVEYMRQQQQLLANGKQKSPMRYDFASHLATKWSIEHIHARNVEGLNTKAEWQSWLEDQKSAIDNINTAYIVGDKRTELEKLKNDVSTLLDEITNDKSGTSFRDGFSEDFKQLAERVLQFFADGNDEDNASDYVHSLSNLALLDGGTNSSIKNSIYMVKQVKITDAMNKGAFMPPLTKAVFMRLFNMAAQGSPFWGKSDRDSYMDKIDRLLINFKQENLRQSEI